MGTLRIINRFLIFSSLFFLGAGCNIQQPSLNKDNLLFSSPTFAMHQKFSSTCASCHLVLKPTSATKSGYTHSSTYDCSACHTPHRWSDAKLPHTPTPTSCNSCHTASRPARIANGSNHIQIGDCVFCHNPGTTWLPAKEPHTSSPTSCNSCHSNTSRSRYNHEGVNFHSAGRDCVTCHIPNVSAGWRNIKSNYCYSCHSNGTGD